MNTDPTQPSSEWEPHACLQGQHGQMRVSVLEGSCGICSLAALRTPTEVGKLARVVLEKGFAPEEPGMEGFIDFCLYRPQGDMHVA